LSTLSRQHDPGAAVKCSTPYSKPRRVVPETQLVVPETCYTDFATHPRREALASSADESTVSTSPNAMGPRPKKLGKLARRRAGKNSQSQTASLGAASILSMYVVRSVMMS
jgi:hypothetical protein